MADSVPDRRRQGQDALSAADILIVGGGLAGAAAGALLGSKRGVVLIEREAAPKDKVCGEFLSPEAQHYLAQLGLDLAALGAVAIRRLRVVADGKVTELDLPFTGLSLSRRVLDEALLDRARAAGVDIRRGQRVTGIARDKDGWRARLDHGRTMTAGKILLATGKHDLRGLPRPLGLHRGLVGFKQHMTLSAASRAELAGCVELFLFDGGYAGLEPVEQGRANLCLVVDRRILLDAGRDWPGLLDHLRRIVPLLERRLDGAVALTPRPVAVSQIPYGHLQWRSDGIWRLGDQAAVIPSFTGDGMAMALHSAALASKMLLQGCSAHAYQRRLAWDVLRPMALATVFSGALVRAGPRAQLAAVARRSSGMVSAVARFTRLPEGRLLGGA